LRILLTGANGQLGHDLISTKPENVEILPYDKESLDITDRDKTLSVISEQKPDVLINTAAYVRVDDAEDNAAEAFSINAVGVKNLVEACNKTGTLITHISTDYVFDGTKAPIPYNEDDIPNPLNTYGLSKFAGEMFVKNYAHNAYIIRTASLYGKSGASGKGGNFVYTVLGRLLKNQTMKVVNDIYMSPTCTYNLAQEIWRMISEKRPNGLYHIVNDGYCSWFEFAKTISDLADIKGEIIPVSHTEYPSKARRPLWSPLMSIKGITIASWEKALEFFLAENIQTFCNEK